MQTIFWLKLYLLTVPVFFAIDMLWLGYVARSFYKSRLDHLLSPEVNWPAALVFYFVYIAGCLYGALFGFFTYATYDLTNLATLRQWPMAVVVVDILWGTVLCTLVGGAAYLIGTRLQ
jgi:uncharacterized membrane protein